MRPGKRRRIVVADDEDGVREFLQTILEMEGHDVRVAVDGQDALEVFREFKPDLVLLDHRMPKKSGMQVLAELRRDFDSLSLPVMLLTADSGPEIRFGGIESGANDYLAKPYERRDLLVRVSRLLQAVELREALDNERSRHQERVDLLLEVAAMVAESAELAELWPRLDKLARERLKLAVSSVFVPAAAAGHLETVYPAEPPFSLEEAEDVLGFQMEMWRSAEGAPPEGEPGYKPAVLPAAGELWFPVRADRRLVAVIGFAGAEPSTRGGALDPQIRPLLAALARLLCMAAENRELWGRERLRLAQAAEMQAATVVQERVLPDRLPAAGQFETAAVTIPASAIGGDYFTWFEYADGSLGAFVADVVGKGLTAAMHTMVLNTLVREHGPLSAGPAELLTRVNGVLCGPLEWTREDPVPCGALRLTAIAGQPVAEYANAGHEPLLRLTAAGEASFAMPGRSFPLGWRNPPVIASVSFPLAQGDAVVLYSDGLHDALARLSRPAAPGPAPQAASLRRSQVSGPRELADWLGLERAALPAQALRQAIERVQEAASLPDDVTILIAQTARGPVDRGIRELRTGDGLELSLSSAPELLAPVRAAVMAFLAECRVPEPAAFQISAVVAEIQTNAIVHGLGKRSDQPLRIGLRRQAGGLEIEVEEFHCGPYSAPELPGSSGLRPGEGGIGLVLARRVMESVEFLAVERMSLRVRMRWSGSVRAGAGAGEGPG